MLDLNINGKRYKAPHSWADISCGEFMALDNWVKDNIPEKFKQFLFDEENPELTQEDKYEIIDFKRRYVCYLTGISEKAVRDIKLRDEKNFGILDMFDALQLFLFFPKDIKPQAVNGYVLDEEATNEQPLRNATFGQFETASIIKNNLTKMSKGDSSGLALLAAVLYRPAKGWWLWKKVVPYNDKDTKKRAKEFEKMSMEIIWGAYFFLLKQRKQSLKTLILSLRGRATRNSANTGITQ